MLLKNTHKSNQEHKFKSATDEIFPIPIKKNQWNAELDKTNAKFVDSKNIAFTLLCWWRSL